MSGINGTGGVKVGELLRECMKALEAAGNDNPRFETEQLVMKFCGVKRSDILMFPGLEVTAEQAAEVRGAVQRRNSGEPLQYILGEWEFYGLPFYVGEGVLIPRQDTETLVEAAVRFLRERPGVSGAADLCAGSGCVGITLAKLTGIPVKSCLNYRSRRWDTSVGTSRSTAPRSCARRCTPMSCRTIPRRECRS